MAPQKKDAAEIVFSESKGAFAPVLIYSAPTTSTKNDQLKVSEQNIHGVSSSQGERFTRRILVALRNLFL